MQLTVPAALRLTLMLVAFAVGASIFAQTAPTPAATASSPATTEPAAAPLARVADLAWLSGHWRGTLKSGATFETFYTDASGNTIVSASKEHRAGRTLTVEFELFYEKDGRVIYQPHPHGARSPHAFPLVAFDAAAKRATFENKEHDFPQTFVFDAGTRDVLLIVLSGPGRNGATKELRYELRRVP
ncbi:MAG: hypothetical protein C0518_16195 [Opitutus sp.]|nr:hypothetical protein [Opitutus sp.]